MLLTSQFLVLVLLVSGSVRPIPRLMLIMVMVVSMEVMVDTVLDTAMAVTDTARGQLTPRLTLTTAMEAMVDTVDMVLATEATAMVVSMEVMADTVWATAMVATDTASKLM